MATNHPAYRSWLVLELSAVLTLGMAAVTPQLAEAGRSGSTWRRGQQRSYRSGVRNYGYWRHNRSGVTNRWRQPTYRWTGPQRWRSGWRNRTPRYSGYYGYYGHPRSYRYPRYRRNDLDRDGIPDFRDRDRDGDGVPNYRDRYQNSRRRW